MQYRAAGIHKLLANYQTAGTTFIPVHRPREPQCRALQTDGRTDRIHDDVNSRSDCVAVRSAKRTHYCMFLFLTVFIVIAASRPVNKNVSTGAVI